MLPVTLWTVRVLAIILWMAHGSYLAVTAADWREDRWDEDMPHPFGSALDLSDTTGLYGGCLSIFFYLVAWIRFRIMLHGCARVLLPVVALGLTLLGWPVSPQWWEGVDFLEALYQLPLVIVAERFFWIGVASFIAGYLGGRLMHRSFFGERV